MLNYFKEKKETFFDLTKMNFLNSSKTHFLTFGQTMSFFFLYQRLIKIRLEIMLSDFTEKKKPFFTLKTECQKNRIFPKGLTHALSQKMPIFPIFRFGQNKT